MGTSGVRNVDVKIIVDFRIRVVFRSLSNIHDSTFRENTETVVRRCSSK